MDLLADNLLEWYDRERRTMPWREWVSPYRTWISEVMLQQTRVETVIPYFERFMNRFPTVHALADGDADEVLSLWSGLGYYSRARNLHKAAKIIVELGYFPDDIKGLRALPGVGEYIAGAVGSIAFGLDVPTVDGNIARVMARLHADDAPRRQMWVHAEKHLPRGRAGDYNQALMDLGSRICIPRRPKCSECPITGWCESHRTECTHLYPPPKKKKKSPEAHLACVIMRQQDQFLLGRRPDEGLWGGLWEFPTIAWGGGDDIRPIEKWSGTRLRRVGEIRHVLTHKIIHLSVFSAGEIQGIQTLAYEKCGYFSPTMMESIGTSRLTSKALELLQSSE